MMVERDGQAAAVCINNANMIQKAMASEGFYDQVTKVSQKAVSSFLSTDPLIYDLVFIDPPYEVSNDEVATNLKALMARLAPDAIVMLERSSRTGSVELPEGLVLDEEKNFGDTTVFWLTRA
jgi:16S rRNA (guanine966-N2)-methyltransferase